MERGAKREKKNKEKIKKNKEKRERRKRETEELREFKKGRGVSPQCIYKELGHPFLA